MNRVLRATLVSAVVITTVIGIASFVLSFAALWDLATMAGVPRQLSWLWPVIVDGTILQATISVIALAQFEGERSGRKFFWTVLVTAALVSIGANAMHAFISQTGTLHPTLSAAIATVAPVSLLAATHGLGILVRVPAAVLEPDHRDATDLVPATAPASAPASAVAAHTPPPPASPSAPATPLETSVEARAVADVAVEAITTHEKSVRERLVVDSIGTLEDPLEQVDRWILDDDRAEDLFPVDAP